MAKDKSALTRTLAIEYLGTLGEKGRAAVSTLETALKDEDKDVRKAAAALKKLRPER